MWKQGPPVMLKMEVPGQQVGAEVGASQSSLGGGALILSPGSGQHGTLGRVAE